MPSAFFQLIATFRDLQNLMITKKWAEIIIDSLEITKDFTVNLDSSTAIQFSANFILRSRLDLIKVRRFLSVAITTARYCLIVQKYLTDFCV